MAGAAEEYCGYEAVSGPGKIIRAYAHSPYAQKPTRKGEATSSPVPTPPWSVVVALVSRASRPHREDGHAPGGGAQTQPPPALGAGGRDPHIRSIADARAPNNLRRARRRSFENRPRRPSVPPTGERGRSGLRSTSSAVQRRRSNGSFDCKRSPPAEADRTPTIATPIAEKLQMAEFWWKLRPQSPGGAGQPGPPHGTPCRASRAPRSNTRQPVKLTMKQYRGLLKEVSAIIRAIKLLQPRK